MLKTKERLSLQTDEKWKTDRKDQGDIAGRLESRKVSCEREKRTKDNRDEKRASMIASSFYVAYKSFSGRTNCVVHP